jgi:hypothetical protein
MGGGFHLSLTHFAVLIYGTIIEERAAILK